MFTRTKAARSVVDPATLEREERSLDEREAQLRARAAELDRLADQAWTAVVEARKVLAGLTHSRAAGMAVEAMGRLPSAPAQPLHACAVPERERADRLRTEALEARKAAAGAEQRALADRQEQIAAWHTAVAAAADTARAIEARAAELEADAAKVAQPPRVAAQPASPPRAGAPTAPGAAKPAAAPEPSRRRAERVRFETEVGLESESNFFTGFSTDLSDGGIFVATRRMALPGTEVDLAFTLPGGRRIEARGVVRWVRDFNPSEPEAMPGVGVEFTSIDVASREAVAAFTGRREPLFWVS